MAIEGIPKLRVPLQFGTTGLLTVDQDSEDEIAQCVYAILATPLGSRYEGEDLLDFGIEDPTFETAPIDLSPFDGAVTRWEPRAVASNEQSIRDGVVTIREKVAAS